MGIMNLYFPLQEENMKLIISHGLQCVVKGKLDEAEVIFTQALLLPDFQRIELKSFVYICLAVVANKRQNKGYVSLRNVGMWMWYYRQLVTCVGTLQLDSRCAVHAIGIW